MGIATLAQLNFGFGGGELSSPLHATFQGGKGEPFHDWYPYLEGFSPEFVRYLLAEYMPDARRIIEPFAGTGTTPIVLSQLGLECGYCEVNPAMRLVIQTKSAVGRLQLRHRKKLALRLRDLSAALPTLVARAPRSESLQSDYHTNFGSSVFFDDAAYEAFLRLRSVADEAAIEEPLLGDILTVAVMAKIVNCSRLKRAGDVRYKTQKELDKGIPPAVAEVSRQLLVISADCESAPHLTGIATPLTPNARNLLDRPSFEADGVITSPPYLNGTNYFRNTKLELWFGRFLTPPTTLRTYRDEAITSGINDVGVAQGRVIVNDDVKRAVTALSQNAYDQRIPRMVAGYFEDMKRVLNGLQHSCRPGATLCVDIGDSRYGGVHVPTHDLLAQVGVDVGLEHVETIHLRTRLSKDKSKLSQSLIIFRNVTTQRKNIIGPATDHRALERWNAFKSAMPHQKPPFSKRNWGSPLHSACSYQAKMKPALAHHLIAAFTEPGELVVDPFSGSGTIPFEACLMGRRGLGMDISLLGTAISNAKLMRADPQRVAYLTEGLAKWLATRAPTCESELDAAKVKFNGPLQDYFHPNTFREVLLARDFFSATREDTPAWYLMMTCMLHVLHGNRPYALSRRSHPITPYAPTGPFEYKSVLEKLTAKVQKCLAMQLPPELPDGRCYQADICKPWPRELRNIDAVITSPPFFDSTRFYMTNWMRYWFCGWSRDDFDTQSNEFVESMQKKSLDVYRGIFQQIGERLRANGFAVLHLGFSRKCDMAAELVGRAGEAFEVLDIATEAVDHCESHGIRDKGTTTGHQYLVLKKKR